MLLSYDDEYIKRLFGKSFSKPIYEYYITRPEIKLHSHPTDEESKLFFNKNSYDDVEWEELNSYEITCEHVAYERYMNYASTHPDDSMLWINPDHKEEDELRIHGLPWDKVPRFQQKAYHDATYNLEYNAEVYSRRDEF